MSDLPAPEINPPGVTPSGPAPAPEIDPASTPSEAPAPDPVPDDGRPYDAG